MAGEGFSREQLLKKINTEFGKQYKLKGLSDQVVYNVYNRLVDAEIRRKDYIRANKEISAQKQHEKYCDECGTHLTDGGYCPICDDGEEDMFESVEQETLATSTQSNIKDVPTSQKSDSNKCPQCGTNLITTSNGKHCPKCNKPNTKVKENIFVPDDEFSV